MYQLRACGWARECAPGAPALPRDRPYAVRLALAGIAFALIGCAHDAASSGGDSAATVDPLQRVSAAELFARGQRLAAAGDGLKAEEYMSAAVQRGFPEQRALPLLMRVCIATSRLGVALNYATPYLNLHPDDYHLRYLVAAVEMGLGRYRDAERELQRVLRDAPEYAEAHYLLAVILRDHDGDTSAAAEQFRLQQRYDAHGLHGAEVAAWLREHELASRAAPPSRLDTPEPAQPQPSRADNPTPPSAATAPAAGEAAP